MRILNTALIAALIMLMPACYATQYGIPAMVNIINNGGVGRSAIGESDTLETGRACATSILGFIAVGDASIQAAANERGITRIANVSHTTEGVLGVTAKYCTVVRGWK